MEFGQALVENTAAKHPELSGLGLAATPPGGSDCVTIADTDAQEIGDKCDKGELAVIKTGKSTVEKEADGYDVTLPLHQEHAQIALVPPPKEDHQQLATAFLWTDTFHVR